MDNLYLIKQRLYNLLSSDEELAPKDLAQIGGLVLRINQYEDEKQKEEQMAKGNNSNIVPIPTGPNTG
jgi:hypothetical protein